LVSLLIVGSNDPNVKNALGGTAPLVALLAE
jgi:hypothetical protein